MTNTHLPTNLKRACWAEIALFAYSDAKSSTLLKPMAFYDDKQDVLTDLLCDLMHYAHIGDGLDFAAALERARTHFGAERADEPS